MFSFKHTQFKYGTKLKTTINNNLDFSVSKQHVSHTRCGRDKKKKNTFLGLPLSDSNKVTIREASLKVSAKLLFSR